MTLLPDIFTDEHKIHDLIDPPNSTALLYISVPTKIYTTSLLVDSVHTWMTQLSLAIFLVSSHHRFHIPMSAPTLNVLSRHYRNYLPNNHELSLYYHFPSSRFEPLAYFSRMHSHDTSWTFIYISTFFVSNITIFRGGFLGHSNHDSIYSICSISSSKYQKRLFE